MHRQSGQSSGRPDEDVLMQSRLPSVEARFTITSAYDKHHVEVHPVKAGAPWQEESQRQADEQRNLTASQSVSTCLGTT